MTHDNSLNADGVKAACETSRETSFSALTFDEHCDLVRTAIVAYLSAANQDHVGVKALEWKLLPCELTDEMRAAFFRAWVTTSLDDGLEPAYAALLAAAPTPPRMQPR